MSKIKWDSITVEPATQKHAVVKNTKDYRPHIKIPALEEMLTGKRVAVVCPSPSLSGKEEGELIDSYDIVVRINQKFKMSEEMEKDYGTRNDIMIGSFNQKNINECNANFEYIKTYKYIIGVMPSSRYPPKIKYFNQLTKQGINNTRLDDKYIYKVFSKIGTVANSGLMGIEFLLNYDIKEMYVAGLNFYNMGKFGEIYNPEYKNSVAKVGQLNNSGDFKIHKIPPQINYFRKLHQEKPDIIKLDSFLTENL